MMFPKFSLDEYHNKQNILFAPWKALNELHKLESDLLLKHSYRLSMKSLRPSSFEKQNVNLVLKIFNVCYSSDVENWKRNEFISSLQCSHIYRNDFDLVVNCKCKISF